MKKIYTFGTALLAVISLVGCNNILDKGPLDTFSNDNFWTSENNVSSYANTFYNNFKGYGNGGGSGDFYFNALNDNQVGSSYAEWTYTSVPATSGNWSDNWTEVRRANIMIEKVPTISAMTSATKASWIGFARLMRAWTYYHLVRMYGNIPWVNKSLGINDDGYLYAARTDRDVVMDSVYNDLNYACANMKSNTSRTTLNQAVAYAMTAEICLYEGTYCKYRTLADNGKAADATRANTFLTYAKNACSAIMSNNNYSLNGSYQGNYNSSDLSSNKEMIFYKAYKQSVLTHSLVDYTCSSTQQSGMSKSAFESYLFTDGKPLSLTSCSTNDAAFELDGTKIVGGKTVATKTMDLSKVLSVRDKRLSVTIDTALCYTGQTFQRYGRGMSMTASSGYSVAKYDNPSIDDNYRGTTSSNFTNAPLFWLSVIYLEYAEACAELGSVTQNDLDISINLIKTRAGLPSLSVNVGFSDPANNMSVSDLIWEVRRERRCELMFDNNFRYWDLVRWHQLDKLDSSNFPNIMLGANIVNDKWSSSVIRTNNYINGSRGKTRTYDKKYYFYPIPSGQLTLNPQLGQNSGW
jgi:SusD family.